MSTTGSQTLAVKKTIPLYLRQDEQEGLREAGHHVDLIDLYAEEFDPRMSTAERQAYESATPILSAQVERHAELVRRAEGLVFVYPTWWSGLPAMLKGWLEKTMLPGVAFVFDDDHRVRPGLGNIRRIVGISCYGSPRVTVAAINDNGRRTLLRALRLNTGFRTRTTWIPFYASDRSSSERRVAFLKRVEERMASL